MFPSVLVTQVSRVCQGQDSLQVMSSKLWVTHLGYEEAPVHWKMIFLVLDCWLSDLEGNFLWHAPWVMVDRGEVGL